MEASSNSLVFTRKRYIRNIKVVSENFKDFCHTSTEPHPDALFYGNLKVLSENFGEFCHLSTEPYSDPFFTGNKKEFFLKAKSFEGLGLMIKPKIRASESKRRKNPYGLDVITKFEKVSCKVSSSKSGHSDDSTPHLYTDYKERLNNILLEYFS